MLQLLALAFPSVTFAASGGRALTSHAARRAANLNLVLGEMAAIIAGLDGARTSPLARNMVKRLLMLTKDGP